jgi:hypothetical protein
MLKCKYYEHRALLNTPKDKIIFFTLLKQNNWVPPPFIFLLVLCASLASSCITGWTSFIISACIACCRHGKWWPVMYTLRNATTMDSKLLGHFQYMACMNHKSQNYTFVLLICLSWFLQHWFNYIGKVCGYYCSSLFVLRSCLFCALNVGTEWCRFKWYGDTVPCGCGWRKKPS